MSEKALNGVLAATLPLSASERLVLIVMAWREPEDVNALARYSRGVEKLAKEAGIHASHAKKCLLKLRDLSLIQRVGVTGSGVIVYRIDPDAVALYSGERRIYPSKGKGVARCDPLEAHGATGGGAFDAKSSRTVRPIRQKTIKNEKEDTSRPQAELIREIKPVASSTTVDPRNKQSLQAKRRQQKPVHRNAVADDETSLLARLHYPHTLPRIAGRVLFDFASTFGLPRLQDALDLAGSLSITSVADAQQKVADLLGAINGQVD